MNSIPNNVPSNSPLRLEEWTGKLHESRSSVQNQSLTKTDKNLNNVGKQEVGDFPAISLQGWISSLFWNCKPLPFYDRFDPYCPLDKTKSWNGVPIDDKGVVRGFLFVGCMMQDLREFFANRNKKILRT